MFNDCRNCGLRQGKHRICEKYFQRLSALSKPGRGSSCGVQRDAHLACSNYDEGDATLCNNCGLDRVLHKTEQKKKKKDHKQDRSQSRSEKKRKRNKKKHKHKRQDTGED